MKARFNHLLNCRRPYTTIQVLRKYSDRTVSADLIQELEAYGGDPSNIVLSSEHHESTVFRNTDLTSRNFVRLAGIRLIGINCIRGRSLRASATDGTTAGRGA
jgi:hypothetical protein